MSGRSGWGTSGYARLGIPKIVVNGILAVLLRTAVLSQKSLCQLCQHAQHYGHYDLDLHPLMMRMHYGSWSGVVAVLASPSASSKPENQHFARSPSCLSLQMLVPCRRHAPEYSRRILRVWAMSRFCRPLPVRDMEMSATPTSSAVVVLVVDCVLAQQYQLTNPDPREDLESRSPNL